MSCDCRYFEELIFHLPDGDLTDTEAEALQAHLRTCWDCRALFRALKDANGALSESVDAPAELASGVMARIAPVSSASRASTIRRKTAKEKRIRKSIAAAACFVLIITGASFGASKLMNAGSRAMAPEAALVMERSAVYNMAEAAPVEEEAADAPEMAQFIAEEPAEMEDAAADEAASRATGTLETVLLPEGREAEFEAIITDSHTEPDLTTEAWDVIAYVEYRGIVYEFLTDAEGQALLWRDAAEGVYPILSPKTADDLLSILNG